MELRFRFYEENITIGQWIEPQDKDHIKTDENGYRILESVKYALFILEDNLDEGLEAHILVYSLTDGWGCWAIQQDGELDKTWIDEVNKTVSEIPKVPSIYAMHQRNRFFSISVSFSQFSAGKNLLGFLFARFLNSYIILSLIMG
jgi:hypothetical protein